MTSTVAVYGAYGHTGRFVVDELIARGFVPILAGRDGAKLRDYSDAYPGLEARVATAEDPASLNAALSGAAAVINCAGPFVATTGPVIEAALRAGIPYVDVAAEVDATLTAFSYAEQARAGGVAVIPAMAFHGGLGDLLVTAAMGDWTEADSAHLAYGKDSWHPTIGTRKTFGVILGGLDGRTLSYRDGGLAYRDTEMPLSSWTFPEPMGERKVLGDFSLADVVTVPSHLAIPEVCGYIPVDVMGDAMAPDTPEPVATDERGRSAQTFVVDAVVRRGGVERRAFARGQDAYAVTAPLAVEAAARLLSGASTARGVLSAGAAFNALEFLRSVSDLSVELSW